MILRTLVINGYDATDQPVEYTCYGLGSCIGLFVLDRSRGIAGGAHIASPTGTCGTHQNADSIIDAMLGMMSERGSDLTQLRAKFTGGAIIIPGLFSVGDANIKAVVRNLTERKIFLAGHDTGGTFSRRARFNSLTGELDIATSNRKSYTI